MRDHSQMLLDKLQLGHLLDAARDIHGEIESLLDLTKNLHVRSHAAEALVEFSLRLLSASDKIYVSLLKLSLLMSSQVQQ